MPPASDALLSGTVALQAADYLHKDARTLDFRDGFEHDLFMDVAHFIAALEGHVDALEPQALSGL